MIFIYLKEIKRSMEELNFWLISAFIVRNAIKENNAITIRFLLC